MTTAAKRMVAAGATVAVAAAVNVATGMLTQKWSLAWWLCTTVLVVVGAALQIWLTRTDGLPDGAPDPAPDPAPAPVRRQALEDTEVEGGSVTQRMPGPGEQVVRRAKVRGDVTQEQND
jgi:hypothetical protein